MCKIKETVSADALQQQGCLCIRSGASKNLLADFHSEINDLASFHLDRLGVPRSTEDAMTDLLKSGGEFRRLLFPHLKNLSSVREIALSVMDRIRQSGVLPASCFERSSIHWLLKADVPGETKYLLPMHQDYNTPCHRAWRAWLPLRDASEENGTLRYVPASHDTGYIEHDASNPELPCVPETRYDSAAINLLEIPAGDIFLFHPLLIHSSVAAAGDRMKYAVIVNFWDLESLADPDDPDDPITARLAMGRTRDQVRGDREPIISKSPVR